MKLQESSQPQQPLITYIPATALRCFTCSYTNENDHLCIDDPISVQGQWQVNCTKKYCTIQRQELQNGQVNSFMRDCQEVPIVRKLEKLLKNIYIRLPLSSVSQVLDGMIEDENFKTYFRSCSTDLCNSGKLIC